MIAVISVIVIKREFLYKNLLGAYVYFILAEFPYKKDIDKFFILKKMGIKIGSASA